MGTIDRPYIGDAYQFYCINFFSFFFLLFLFFIFLSLSITTMPAVVFLAIRLVGVLAAFFFTFQSFRRHHEQGMKIWSAFWITLILEFFVLGIIDGILNIVVILPADAIFGFIPYYTILQICRFVVIWMLIAQAAGDHIVAAYKKVGLLSE